MQVEFESVSLPRGGSGDHNEDAFAVLSTNGSSSFFAVVVDGHGFGDASRFASFAANYLRDLFVSQPYVGIDDLFGFTQDALESEFGRQEIGAVAGCVIVREDRLVVAHAGDVRLYADVRERKRTPFVRFTRDHNCDHPDEIERLRPFIQSGKFACREYPEDGWGAHQHVARLHYFGEDGKISNASLQPTRGFGDPEFRPAFTHVPDVTEVKLEGSLRRAVFALSSDGAHRTVGRTFAFLEGKDAHIAAYIEAFRELIVREGDDDATAIFFRIIR